MSSNLPINPYDEAQKVLADLVMNRIMKGEEWRDPVAAISHCFIPGQDNVACGAVVDIDINKASRRVEFYCAACVKNFTIDFQKIGL